MKILAILLGRVSTEDQKTIPEQLKEIRLEIEKRAETIVEELTEFHKVSSEEDDTDILGYK